jgi:hypothetical protein
METELAYFRRRSAQEAKAAASANDGKVRDVHLELRRRYDDRISALEAQLNSARIQLVRAD